MFSMRISKSTLVAGFALSCMVFFNPAASHAKSLLSQHLFKIERSKNANIVQYDVQIKADGTLDPAEPVIAYWLRLAEEGQKEDLKWVEKTFAYGFKVKYSPDTNTATLDMAAKINRKITVREVQGEYRAETAIDGRSAYLEKIYICSKGKGLMTEVVFIELYGLDESSGESRYEKIIP